VHDDTENKGEQFLNDLTSGHEHDALWSAAYGAARGWDAYQRTGDRSYATRYGAWQALWVWLVLTAFWLVPFLVMLAFYAAVMVTANLGWEGDSDASFALLLVFAAVPVIGYGYLLYRVRRHLNLLGRRMYGPEKNVTLKQLRATYQWLKTPPPPGSVITTGCDDNAPNHSQGSPPP
jgi:hypothetical protein